MVKQRPGEAKQGKVNGHRPTGRSIRISPARKILFSNQIFVTTSSEAGWCCRIAVKPRVEPHTMPSRAHRLRPGKRSARDFTATRRDRWSLAADERHDEHGAEPAAEQSMALRDGASGDGASLAVLVSEGGNDTFPSAPRCLRQNFWSGSTTSSNDRATVVYLLLSPQYQIFNYGVMWTHACRS
jgi:hypothetical protein